MHLSLPHLTMFAYFSDSIHVIPSFKKFDRRKNTTKITQRKINRPLQSKDQLNCLSCFIEVTCEAWEWIGWSIFHWRTWQHIHKYSCTKIQSLADSYTNPQLKFSFKISLKKLSQYIYTVLLHVTWYEIIAS